MGMCFRTVQSSHKKDQPHGSGKRRMPEKERKRDSGYQKEKRRGLSFLPTTGAKLVSRRDSGKR